MVLGRRWCGLHGRALWPGGPWLVWDLPRPSCSGPFPQNVDQILMKWSWKKVTTSPGRCWEMSSHGSRKVVLKSLLSTAPHLPCTWHVCVAPEDWDGIQTEDRVVVHGRQRSRLWLGWPSSEEPLAKAGYPAGCFAGKSKTLL